MAIDFSLAQPGNFAAAALTGYQAGRQIGRERRTQAVLSGFQADPEGAIAQAYAFDPELGDKLTQRQGRAKLGEALAASAPEEMKPFARLNPEAYQKLDEAQRERLKVANEYLGNAALRIAQLPPEQRPQAWDAAVDGAANVGIPGAERFKGQYSDNLLNSVIDQTGHTKELLEASQPKYMAVPEGGTLVNTRDPAAIASFGAPTDQPAQIGSQADYQALPPGAQYIAPDGSVRRKGGAASNGGGNFPK